MSSRQLFFLYALIVPAFKVAMLPSYLAGSVGQDMWISVGVAMLIDIAILGAILFIKTRVGVLEYSNRAVRLISKGISVVLALYFVLQACVLFEEVVAYLLQSFFDEAERLQIIVPLGIAIAYLAIKGGNTLGRLGEMLVWGLLLTILASVVFNRAEIDYTNILPIFDKGVSSIFGAKENVVWFGDYLPLLFINIRDRKKRRYGYIFGGAFVTLVLTTFTVMTFYSQWGDLTGNIPNAFARLSGYNFISTDVGKIDWLTILTWIASCTLKLSVLLLGVKGAINYVVGKNVSKITVPVSAFIVTMSVYLFIKDVKTAYTVGTQLWPLYLGISVVAIIVLLVFSIFNKGERYGKDIQK